MSKSRKKKSPKVKSVPKPFVMPDMALKQRLLLMGGFILLALLLYFQCFGFGYVLDDKLVISDNNFTKNGFAGLWDILTTDSFQGYFGEQKNLLQGGRYRPLSIMTFAVEHQFFGLNPTVSHVINVLLYGIGAYLCFLSLKRLFKDKSTSKSLFISLAFLSTLLFLLHPIHIEAVANIKGRDEIMSFIFSMLALTYALRYVDASAKSDLIKMIVTFFLGILSKENTITFLAIIPFALLLFRKGYKKQTIRVGLSLFATTVVYLIMRYMIMGYLLNENTSTDVMNNPFVGMDGGEKLATIFYTLLLYLKLCVVPHPLTHDYYPYHIPIMNFANVWVIISVVFHLLLAAGVFYFWKKKRVIAFSIGFYLAAMSIVSNLVVSVGTFMNERFAFTASLGICILMVYLFKSLDKKFGLNNKLLIGIMAIFGIGFIYKTYDRVPAWENALTLNREAIKVSKNSARANSFMSTALFNEYKQSNNREEKIRLLNEAQPYAIKAVTLIPNYSNGNLMRAGIAAEQHKMHKDLDALLAEFKAVIMVRPDVNFVTEYLDYLKGRADLNTLMAFYVDIGQSMLNSGRNLEWAVHYLKRAYDMDSQNTQIRSLLFQINTRLGYHEEAANYK